MAEKKTAKAKKTGTTPRNKATVAKPSARLVSPKVTHRDPIEKDKDYIVLGYGAFHENLKPYWGHMGGSDVEMRTKADAIEEMEWHRKNNPEFDVRVFKLEPVAFSADA